MPPRDDQSTVVLSSPTEPSITVHAPTPELGFSSWSTATPSPRSENTLTHPLDFGVDSALSTKAAELSLGLSDLELLAHFLGHTSHLKVTEIHNVYAWRVGIPNLALHSTPLMHTILSVSALCLCVDSGHSLDLSTVSPSSVESVTGRLATAVKHHEASVRDTIDGIKGGRSSIAADVALINASLMIQYSFTAYQVRHWLYNARLQLGFRGKDIDPPPAMLSWIGLLRASSAAVIGFVANSRSAKDQTASPSTPDKSKREKREHREDGDCQIESLSPNATYPPDAAISPLTTHALFPHLASTATPALNALQQRTDARLRLHLPTPTITSCSAALAGLHKLRATILCSPDVPCAECASDRCDTGGIGDLGGMSDWVKICVLPQAEGIPHPSLPRAVIGWSTRVAQDFIGLVLSAVDDSGSSMTEWTMEHRVAVDIFSHWLVFLMLLSELWWVRRLGAIELRRMQGVMDMMRETNAGEGEEWWPWRMLRAAEQHI